MTHPLSGNCRAYDHAVARGWRVCAEVWVPDDDYRDQPEFWGEHGAGTGPEEPPLRLILRHPELRRGAWRRLLVPVPDTARLAILTLLADRAVRGRIHLLKALLPRDEIARRLDERAATLVRFCDTGAAKLCAEFQALARTLRDGTCSIARVRHGLNEVQRPDGGRTPVVVARIGRRLTPQRNEVGDRDNP